jgi:2-dehydropantoate 2-reductase
VSRIAILGAGGVGGLLAGALARADEDVVVVARAQTAAHLARDGLQVRSQRLGDFAVPVRAVQRLSEPVETLLVATKAVGLADALERIEAPPKLTVPLLNGVEHLARLRDRFGHEAVAAGTIRVDANRTRPGLIVQSGPNVHVELAADAPAPAGRLPALAERLRAAGVSVRIGEREVEVMWSKLVRLVALSLSTTAADRTLGELREDPEWHRRLLAAVHEASAVAEAEGAPNAAAVRVAELEAAHAGLGSSMRRDVAGGRPPELDAIAGAVLRAGRRHGIACPTLDELSGMVAARACVPAPSV